MSLSSWLVAGVVPGTGRHPLKTLGTNEDALLKLLFRWRDEAVKAGRKIERIAGELHSDPINLWDRLKSPIRFIPCAASGSSF
jgi:transposase